MNFQDVQMEAIDAVLLDGLVSDEVAEGKTIEYKSALPGRADGEKIEFLADVSSFGNAGGGHILYGVIEQGGIPITIPGLPGIDPDQERQRLESMLRDGLDPRLPGVGCRAVRASNGEFVVVIRIPGSWASPHMIAFKQHSRFYARNSAGKYALDVAELRAAFALTDSVGQRVRAFRNGRIGRIVSAETPVPLVGRAAAIIHVLPISAFARGSRDLIFDGATERGLDTFGGGFYDWRLNFDGILACGSQNDRGESVSYTQLFRDGCIEAVGCSAITAHPQGGGYIPSVAFEKKAIERVTSFLAYLGSHRVEPPTLVMLTLVGVKGFRMEHGSPYHDADYRIDRDVLAVPDVMFTGDQSIPHLLKPCFDAIWNACGLRRSLNYTESGEWMPQP
jgi:hypothetical protein